MGVLYRDISELGRKSKILGDERIPVSDREYVTLGQVYDEMSLVRGGVGQINIHTKKSTRADGTVDLWTVIEVLADDDLVRLSDPAKYRLCLMRFRKGEKSGRSWHISALPYIRAARTGKPIAPKSHAIAEEHTWWPVTGREVAWFRGVSILDVLPYEIGARNRFKNSKNLKMLDGVALFKYTGGGGEGWTRVSNIAFVESFLARRNSTDPEKPPYVQISVKM